MSERDYTKAPFDFDLPDFHLSDDDWIDPFIETAPSEEIQKKPGDLFRDVRHGSANTFPTQKSVKSASGEKIRYGKLNWNNSF